MHLSERQYVFSQFFSAFFESALNFENFQKKMIIIGYLFPNLPTTKDMVRKMSKAPIWEDLSTSDMVNGPKHWFNINESTFIILTDHCAGNGVAKVTLRDMEIL